MKVKITRKRVNLRHSFFINYVRASFGNSLQYLICLKSERAEKCKVTFGLIYICIFIRTFEWLGKTDSIRQHDQTI